ncbi:MAG: hypothetical protein QOK21_3402 [Solirubrobacteraceae bacterium]|jgi:hypothetical protein|nr:hypothetical protein [Solirubrobacteraceae bacterium]
MAWIVKSWRREALAALADAEALEAAQEIVLGAQREARRIERGARRESADAGAYLAELERFGQDTLAQVAAHRAELRSEPPEQPSRAPEQPALAPEEPPGPISVRKGRASLRDSPLTELFRATEPG